MSDDITKAINTVIDLLLEMKTIVKQRDEWKEEALRLRREKENVNVQ